MVLDIRVDKEHFERKIRRLKEEGMDKYFSSETTLLPQPNGKVLRIPIRRLEIPKFIFGEEDADTVGQGDGEVGDPLPWLDEKENPYHSGSGTGEHSFAELSIEEAVDILGKKLELPNLLEKFSGEISLKLKNRYKSIQQIGPHSLRHPKRTFKKALQRTIASGTYNPDEPLVIPRKSDERFKAPIEEQDPTTKAAIIYILDSSYSMINVLEFLQNVGWWTDTWIRKHYDHVDARYIHYDDQAYEVTRDEVYAIGAGYGTNMNAGLSLAATIARHDYPASEYNLYLIHFTDGDYSELGGLTEKELEEFRKMAEEEPEIFGDENLLEIGNPLTDYLIHRCNGIFVVEAGAGYEENYSGLLEKMVGADPSLDKKLRFVSYTEDEIGSGQGEKIKETLVHLFKS